LRELLDGRLLVFHQGRLIAAQPAPTGPFTLLARQSGSSKRRRLALGLHHTKPPASAPIPTDPLRAPWAKPRRSSAPRPQTHPWKQSVSRCTAKRETEG
jgi:hypothetical protein